MGKPYVFPVLNFRGRSPFQVIGGALPGVPPSYPNTPVVEVRDGQAFIGGTPLTPWGSPMQTLALSSSSLKDVAEPDATYNRSIYGNAVTLPVVFAGAGEAMILARPSQTRISLLIQNLNIAGGINYCFDRPADNASCILIANGGNRLFDISVPQGDLHVFAAGAGTVILEFMNQDIAAPRTSA